MNNAPLLFASDLHLNAKSTERNQKFVRFIDKIAAQSRGLYILGDLFDSWLGDDDDASWIQPIIAACRSLKEKNIALYCMRGNHDFMLGDTFAELTQCTLIPDPFVLHEGRHKLLLTHGDLLCTLDQRYQRIRPLYHARWIHRILYCLPMSWRQHCAELLFGTHIESMTPRTLSDDPKYNVTETGIEQLLQEHECELLIHGHTHRPGIQPVVNRDILRVTLGAWMYQSEYLQFHSLNELTLSPLSV